MIRLVAGVEGAAGSELMNGTEVVATTGDPAFAVDLEGRILAWNEAAEFRLGYRECDVVGRSCWKILRGRDLFDNRYCGESCALRDMARRGEPFHRTEMVFRNALGEMARTDVSVLVVHGKAGKEVVHLLQCLEPSTEETRTVSDAARVNSNARLSARQLEVLRHLGSGKRTDEIAELLCISPATVRHHIQHILARLKVHSRLEAVTLAQRIGLL